MLTKLLRFGRRQLHTIVSREIIKPSSPTPSRNRTYNLSVLDQVAIETHSPIVAFYPNLDQSSLDKTPELKNPLSKTLTQYYPFAGRVKKYRPTFVDCNDEGVEYIEASNDSSLSDFLQRSNHEDLHPLFPNDLLWFDPHIRGDSEGVTCPLAVQVNKFTCGGVAVASTLSHKVGDARSLLNFINHWAAVNAKKDTSLINPHIIPCQGIDYSKLPTYIKARSRDGCVTRSFYFPDQKLNDLKAKVIAMAKEAGQPIEKPTKIEVLSWLIHNRAMTAAAKNNSGALKPSGMAFPTDLRSMMVEKLPRTTLGNLIVVIDFPTKNQSELAPQFTVGEMRKGKVAFQSIPNVDTAMEIAANMPPEVAQETSKRLDECYIYSSLYRFPTSDIDFGWGKPVKLTLGGTIKNLVIFYAAPNGNGIEASVCLEKEDMEILQKDPELLAFC
ncbi:akuammiline synthase 1-like [Bidens hawaiensis]|uniref:akuammiline synthase 1-like n=1 Tax=Bidens hawaiensis TaxID=980011 RepID=UPI00404AE9BF